MNRDEKAAAVAEIAERIDGSEAIFAVDYRGITVTQAGELRARLRDADAQFSVVKNTLTERAADQVGADGLKGLLEGPTALTFVRGDAALAAKALNDFARASNLLEFKGGLMNGEALSPEDVRSIARLPAREVLMGQFVGVVASPLTGLVRGLNGLVAGLAIQLRQIEEQGLVGDAAPAAAGDGDGGEPAADGDAPAADGGEAPAAEGGDEPAAAAATDETSDGDAA